MSEFFSKECTKCQSFEQPKIGEVGLLLKPKDHGQKSNAGHHSTIETFLNFMQRVTKADIPSASGTCKSRNYIQLYNSEIVVKLVQNILFIFTHLNQFSFPHLAHFVALTLILTINSF